MHFLLDRVADIQPFDEVIDGLLGNRSIGARQFLESFVGLGIAFATKDRLQSFGYHSPVVLKILV